MITSPAWSQFPSRFKYQAVARDASGNVLADQSVNTEIQILQGSESGTLIYFETQDLSLAGTNLSISGGSTVNISSVQDGYEANTDGHRNTAVGSHFKTLVSQKITFIQKNLKQAVTFRFQVRHTNESENL